MTARKILWVCCLLMCVVLTAAWTHGVGNFSNGGKTQLVLNWLGNGELAFNNELKSSAGWQYANPNDLDANGYPICITSGFCSCAAGVCTISGGINMLADIPSQAELPGNWCVDWTSTGSGNTIAFVSTQYSGAGGSGMSPPWCITPTGYTAKPYPGSNGTNTGSPGLAAITVAITTLTDETSSGWTASPVQNLRLYYAGACTASDLSNYAAHQGCGDYAALQAGEVYTQRAYDANGVLHSEFVGLLGDAKIGTIRFMNWQVPEDGQQTSNVTRYAYERPTTYAFYGGDWYPASLFIGNTANGGSCTVATGANDYCGTCPSGTFCYGAVTVNDKDTVIVRVTASTTTQNISGVSIASEAVVTVSNASAFSSGQKVMIAGVNGVCVVCGGGSGYGTINTAVNFFGPQLGYQAYYTIQSTDTVHNTITLNANTTGYSAYSSGGIIAVYPTFSLNGLTAYPIVDMGGNSLACNGNLTGGLCEWPLTDYYATLVFDAGLGVWIKQGGDTQLKSAGIRNRVPPKLLFQLANEVGANAWVMTPQLSIDSDQGWVTAVATLATSTLKGGLKFIIEPPDETWNFQFPQTSYGYYKANAEFADFDVNQWYGEALSIICQDVAAVFGQANAGKSYWCVGGEHTQSGPANTASEASRFNSTDYVSNGGKHAYNYSTHLATTSYWYGGTAGDVRGPIADAATAADIGTYITGNSTQQAAALADYAANQFPWNISSLVNTGTSSSTASVAVRSNLWATYAAAITVPQIPINYEGTYYTNPIYNYAAAAPVSGLSAASPAVLTLGNDGGGTAYSGIAGENVTLSGFTGACGTALNGNTYQVSAGSSGSATIAFNNLGATCASSGLTGTMTYGGFSASISSLTPANTSTGYLCVLNLTGTNPFSTNLGTTVQPLYGAYNTVVTLNGITDTLDSGYTKYPSINAVTSTTVTVNADCTNATASSASVNMTLPQAFGAVLTAVAASPAIKQYNCCGATSVIGVMNASSPPTVFPSYFAHVGPTSGYTLLFEPDIFTPPSQIWNSVAAYNGGQYP